MVHKLGDRKKPIQKSGRPDEYMNFRKNAAESGRMRNATLIAQPFANPKEWPNCGARFSSDLFRLYYLQVIGPLEPTCVEALTQARHYIYLFTCLCS
jgi:hypothetical protein